MEEEPSGGCGALAGREREGGVCIFERESGGISEKDEERQAGKRSIVKMMAKKYCRNRANRVCVAHKVFVIDRFCNRRTTLGLIWANIVPPKGASF